MSPPRVGSELPAGNNESSSLSIPCQYCCAVHLGRLAQGQQRGAVRDGPKHNGTVLRRFLLGLALGRGRPEAVFEVAVCDVAVAIGIDGLEAGLCSAATVVRHQRARHHWTVLWHQRQCADRQGSEGGGGGFGRGATCTVAASKEMLSLLSPSRKYSRLERRGTELSVGGSLAHTKPLNPIEID